MYSKSTSRNRKVSRKHNILSKLCLKQKGVKFAAVGYFMDRGVPGLIFEQALREVIRKMIFCRQVSEAKTKARVWKSTEPAELLLSRVSIRHQ